MADLTPIPLPILVKRMFRELEAKKSAFHLPRFKFAKAASGRDLSTSIFGRRAATPFGPAAGPHTQLAQNIVLSWLAGGRVIELKTVQVLDHLEIARPCIDMETVGFNIEWSQELSLEQSLEEYVKAMMLIEMAKAEGLAPGLEDTVIDMSVGYDLAGIRSDKVRAFIAGMKDASAVIDRLRLEIPENYARFRDLAFPTCISDSVTISTFHGCPPSEIEAIAAHLMAEEGLDVVVKLNPTLLGKADLNALLHDKLGYTDLVVPDATFEKDAKWEDVRGIISRLGGLAEKIGRGFGVKFSNTLLVQNHKQFFPEGTGEMYLSGPPLHVLAIELVARFRAEFGDRFPISFSAGIDVGNFADTVALGLKPVSVCTDLLKGAGYGKGADYIADLADRMAEVEAPDLDSYALKAFGLAGQALDDLDLPAERKAMLAAALEAGDDLRETAGQDFQPWVSATRLRNTVHYAARVADDRRYSRPEVDHPPRRTGLALAFLDCETCGKCVNVCPNDAIFRYPLPQEPVASATFRPGEGVVVSEAQPVTRAQQIGIFADVCNRCGNCDVTCPETGGPYARKANLFGSAASLDDAPDRDGLAVERTAAGLRLHVRDNGRRFTIDDDGARLACRGDGFDLSVDPSSPTAVSGTADQPVDIGRIILLARIARAVTAPTIVTYANAAFD
ncbi:4Fe-4S dicluster domain-containing protein [Pleomorphomonas sp. NRK KF1]|uniref:4Fe-4S dicluster domain-containing protein n=1 Tax=Pleomorphomonas sp. NRK KF1 TaxID=2943000 RepID=UPI002044A156|nr:4Fe-4S dicluster domain-containing protein [Pleomorphomonas sp. NRK KF1]MCM5553680.1 4Fe-4S dicluster domain-containing protein [Pleomorphomonas sp. NRK KF1]